MSRPAQTLGRRSIYLLPTREGLWFAATVFVLLLAAVNYGNGLAYAVTFLLAAFATLSSAQGQRNLLGLVVHEGLPRPAFAGSVAGFRVILANPTDTPRLGVIITGHPGPPITVDLGPREQRGIEIPWPTTHRGVVPAPRVRISSRYPFGLMRVFSRRIALEDPAIVYPRPAPYAPLPAGNASEDPDSETAAHSGSGGGDFAGLADYRPGENPRHIHWRAMAAGKGVLIKRFAGLAEREIWLALDTGGDREEGLRRLCRQSLDAEKGGWRYGLVLEPLCIAPGAGAAHLERCLKSLALYDGTRR
ncbi:DUF58 domain-containing protein [Acidiferrobacter sp.]|uniref:DUF58 domain-containing protein n=1 Tax=Acidiferrobacter sp. TaxID=1872107 RepID=UPI0026036E34|nr:DUF58 domain-containing protein [Acidiferrobacter sp.]